MPTLSKNVAVLLMLLLLNLSLPGCATSSPSVVQPARIPAPPPELMEPEDQSVTYSELVRRILSDWRAKLTDWRRSS